MPRSRAKAHKLAPVAELFPPQGQWTGASMGGSLFDPSCLVVIGPEYVGFSLAVALADHFPVEGFDLGDEEPTYVVAFH